MSRNWKYRLSTIAVASAAAVVCLAAPAHAAPLTNVSWSVSQPQPSVAGVRYTWTFTTPSGGLIDTVKFTVPAATAGGALSVVDVYGLTGGTAALVGTTVTYTVTTPAAVAPGTSILISIDGFTNTGTPNPAYTSAVTTTVGGVNTDTATSGAVPINNNATTINVIVPRSTAFASDTTGFNLLMDPSVVALTDQTKTVNLTIATNAAGGYTLNMAANQPLTGSHQVLSTFTPVTANMSTGVATGSFPADRFGYSMTTSNGTLGSTPLTNGHFVGYVTGGGENVLTRVGPTNGDTVSITNRAKIDYQQPADNYSAIVTYTVTPNY